ncbi:MAG: hypothetical protein Q9227_001957 [Pyrenula ochraceoflavens]
MLLTQKSPVQNGIKEPHEYLSILNSTSRYSPPAARNDPLQSTSESAGRRMSNSHRGLPPPPGMTLPPPDRGLPAMAPLSQLPAPSSQWNNNEESSRIWYQAKAEEDRRKQEEEKTKQEGLRLDQRKIEQNILVESLHGGIPPYMVPIIFAGMGGGNLSQATMELAQQAMAHLQQQHQHQQQMQIQAQVQQQAPAAPAQHTQNSPDLRRESRMIPPNPYGGQQPPLQPAIPSAPPPGQPSQGQLGRPSAPTSAPRGSSQSTLPRLNTTEVHQQSTHHSTHPLQHSQTTQQENQQQASPSIYFHHYVPPNQQSNANQPSTPSGKSQHGSPFSQNQQSHLRSEYQSSPKKRKAAGGHQAPPPPTSQPPATETSPPFSRASSRGTPPEGRRGSPTAGGNGGGGGGSGPRRGGRRQSDASTGRGFHQDVLRPSSRQQLREAANSTTTTSVAVPSLLRDHGQDPKEETGDSHDHLKREGGDETHRSVKRPRTQQGLAAPEIAGSRAVELMAGPSSPSGGHDSYVSTILTRKNID